MSEQEKKSGGGIKEGSSMVVVEQSTASRHKPYRPSEEQADLHPKRSRAPAVPSVAEELKDAAAKNADSKERRDCEQAIASEKHKHSVAKKLSSSTKRRDSSPEAITLAPIEVESKLERVGVPAPQPVSPAVAVPSATKDSDLKTPVCEKKEPSKNDDEDSITDEIADLRTDGAVKKTSEWGDSASAENYIQPQEIIATQANGATDGACEYPILMSGDTNATPMSQEEMDIVEISNAQMDEMDEPKEVVVLDVQDRRIYEELQTASGEEESVHYLSSADEGDMFHLNPKIMSSPNICNSAKKKGISWDDQEYQEKIPLQDMTARSQPWMSVERKASVGPCFRTGMPFSGPSGITLCLPRKPMKNISDSLRTMPSGISITVSKKNLSETTKSRVNVQYPNTKLLDKVMEKSVKRVEDSYVKFFGMLRGKMENVRGKIRNVVNL